MGQEDIIQDSLDSTRNSKDAFFDPKPKPKMIRVLTVLAYVLSVSMAAIFLSIYYIFMWHGEPHLGARRSVPYDANRIGESELGLNFSWHIASQPLARIAAVNKINDFNSSNLLNTENIDNEENKTIADMQQQFTAMEESEVSLPVPATTSEDNTTAWQDDYDSPEDLRKTSMLIKKLRDRDRYEENY